jgi:histidine triad (HIT) family protein
MLSGERPGHVILQDERFAALLEPRPLEEGHVIVFPKTETDAVFDLDDATLSALVVFAKRVATALKRAIPCTKVAMMAYGLATRHAHLHLVPVSGSRGEIDLQRERAEAPAERLEAIASRVRERL